MSLDFYVRPARTMSQREAISLLLQHVGSIAKLVELMQRDAELLRSHGFNLYALRLEECRGQIERASRDELQTVGRRPPGAA